MAWVSSIDGNNVHIEEYIYDYKGNYHEGTVAANSASGYIHIKDIPQPAPIPEDNYGSRMEIGGIQTIADGDYHIVSALDTDESSLRRQCLTIAYNSLDNGANAQLLSVRKTMIRCLPLPGVEMVFMKLNLNIPVSL